MPSRFVLSLLSLILITVAVADLAGQSTSKSKTKGKPGATSVKALDARVQKLENNLFQEIVEISGQYEEAGQPERAKVLLDVLTKLNPKLPGLKEKLEQLETKIFDAQEVEVEVDTSKGWSPVGAAAVKGKQVRVEIEGDYKFQYSATVTGDGITSAEAGPDYIEGIPCGAMMALIITNGKPGKPMQLKSKTTWTPSEDGVVMLKVNTPAGHKSTGKLTVKVSGLVRPE